MNRTKNNQKITPFHQNQQSKPQQTSLPPLSIFIIHQNPTKHISQPPKPHHHQQKPSFPLATTS